MQILHAYIYFNSIRDRYDNLSRVSISSLTVCVKYKNNYGTSNDINSITAQVVILIHPSPSNKTRK